MGKKENSIVIFIRIAFIFCTVAFLWGRFFMQHGTAVFRRGIETEADMWMLGGFLMAAFAACYFAHKSYRGYRKFEKVKEELDRTQYMFQVERLLTLKRLFCWLENKRK